MELLGITRGGQFNQRRFLQQQMRNEAMVDSVLFGNRRRGFKYPEPLPPPLPYSPAVAVHHEMGYQSRCYGGPSYPQSVGPIRNDRGGSYRPPKRPSSFGQPLEPWGPPPYHQPTYDHDIPMDDPDDVEIDTGRNASGMAADDRPSTSRRRRSPSPVRRRSRSRSRGRRGRRRSPSTSSERSRSSDSSDTDSSRGRTKSPPPRERCPTKRTTPIVENRTAPAKSTTAPSGAPTTTNQPSPPITATPVAAPTSSNPPGPAPITNTNPTTTRTGTPLPTTPLGNDPWASPRANTTSIPGTPSSKISELGDEDAPGEPDTEPMNTHSDTPGNVDVEMKDLSIGGDRNSGLRTSRRAYIT
ncbi:hypothetical protein CC2G_001329 [Coprinopsis cinerea AmutBmut pab1-1]|nr:hypothetical protein CC2G_001329 [Coprinopsis cinerea AmutBmut pab1-1]